MEEVIVDQKKYSDKYVPAFQYDTTFLKVNKLCYIQPVNDFFGMTQRA